MYGFLRSYAIYLREVWAIDSVYEACGLGLDSASTYGSGLLWCVRDSTANDSVVDPCARATDSFGYGDLDLSVDCEWAMLGDTVGVAGSPSDW